MSYFSIELNLKLTQNQNPYLKIDFESLFPFRNDNCSVMDAKKVLLIDLFQGIVNIAVFAACKEDSTLSRSAVYTTRENKRLKGHVVKRFESPSLLSCSHSCLRNSWCTSTNFKVSLKKNGKGTCELNKHGAIDANTEFDDQKGVTFSLLLKVISCLLLAYFHKQII